MSDLQELADAELVAACRRGQPEAWDALVARYERLVYTIPFRYGLPQGEADDVFQTVWLALLRHLPTLKEPDRVAAWLVTTAKRACWDRRRGAAHERTFAVDPAEMGALDAAFDQASPEEVVTRFDEHRSLRAALQRLQERCRELLRYLYHDPEQPSYEEIALRLNMAVGSIGPTRARCLAKLRELLEAS